MKELYFSHIPKTAGRTINDIFKEISKKLKKNIYIGEEYFYQVILKKHKYYYENFLQDKYLRKIVKFDNDTYKYDKTKNHWNIKFWHIPLSFWKDEILLKYKKEKIIFIVVRNPYDRIISDFKFWIKFYKLHKNSKTEKFYSNLLSMIEDIYENDYQLTSVNLNKFVNKVLTKKYKYSLDGHLIPQHKYAYTVIDNKLIKIPNEILRFENLENDFIKFKKKYIPLITNKAIKETHLNPTQNKDLNNQSLSLKNKNKIYNYYKLDFKIFDYPK
tara:strand:+ start:1452 stop:2267 length:816 start_codon:yes stop_codon:yes gene_type:complete